MKHELIIEKGVRRIIDESYTVGMIVGAIGGLAMGFIIGLGYG